LTILSQRSLHRSSALSSSLSPRTFPPPRELTSRMSLPHPQRRTAVSDAHSQSNEEATSRLDDLGDEFGVYRFPNETNVELAHRLLAELADMVCELNSTQRLVQQLIS
jgi:hypothetical protein